MNKDFEKYCYKVIYKYSKILLLDKHLFRLEYPTENKEAVMECVCNYPYLNVTLKYGDLALKEWKKKKEDCIPFVVHEMCHVITDPLYCKSIRRFVSRDEIGDEREKLTDYISHIVIKGLKK